MYRGVEKGKRPFQWRLCREEDAEEDNRIQSVRWPIDIREEDLSPC